LPRIDEEPSTRDVVDVPLHSYAQRHVDELGGVRRGVAGKHDPNPRFVRIRY
jgi:hypothetical protein